MRISRAVAIFNNTAGPLSANDVRRAAARMESLIAARGWTPRQFSGFLCEMYRPDPLAEAIRHAEARASRGAP